MSWKSIFWYVFAVRGGYGNAAARPYHLAMGALLTHRCGQRVPDDRLRRCALGGGPNHVTGPLFAFSSVVLVLSMGLLALLTVPLARRAFRRT